MRFLVTEDEDGQEMSKRDKNRFRFANSKPDTEISLSDIKDRSKFDYDLAFKFLKTKDPDILKAVMKKFLRKARLPFRDFDKSKEEYFDRLPEFSNERIEFEEAIRKACEDYIEDIDPEQYDRQQLSRRNMNNFMMGMMMGLLEENERRHLKENKMKRENKMKKYTKKQILESIRYWQKQLKLGNYKKLNESTSIGMKNPTPKQLYGFLKTCNPNALIQIIDTENGYNPVDGTGCSTGGRDE